MRTARFSLICIALACILVSSVQAAKRGDTSGGVSLPRRPDGKPARNLIYQGHVLDADEASTLSSDILSQLDPAPNNTWQPRSFPISNESDWGFPLETTEFAVESLLSPGPGLFRAFIVDRATGKKFRLNASLAGHNVLILAGLLRKLGFPLRSPKHYRVVHLDFPGPEQRETFVRELGIRSQSSPDRWIVNMPEKSGKLVLRDIVLETDETGVVPIYQWGMLVRNNRQDDIKSFRAQRSLVVPFVLTDVNERVNLFSWELGRIVDNSVLFPHYLFADPFNGETTYEDGRWMARKIARITRPEWERIVMLGNYPKDVAELVTEKLISRRNHMVELFELQGELPPDLLQLPFTPLVSNTSVKKGKLEVAHFDGCAHEFIHADPLSPLRTIEVARFLGVEGINYAIQEGIRRLNEKLNFQTVDDLSVLHQQDMFDRMIAKFFQNPNNPIDSVVQTWGGPIGGLNLQASRNVVSGTYYGTDAKIQLVDTLSVGANVGWFLGMEGFKNFIPSLNANLMLQKSYVHVRPIPLDSFQAGDERHKDPMDTALRSDVRDILIPKFMDKIGQVLELSSDSLTEADKTLDQAAQEQKQYEKALQNFFDKMNDGEMLIVAYTAAPNVGLRLGIPLISLLGVNPMGLGTSLGFGVNVPIVIMSRTTFVKGKDSVHVYQQSMNSEGVEFSTDLTFWMQLLKAGQLYKMGSSSADAYLASAKPTEKEPERIKKWVDAFRTFFYDGDIRLFKEYFPPFNIKNDLGSSLGQVGFLGWSGYNVEESNRVVLEPPSPSAQDPNKQYNVSDKTRTLFSHRLVSLGGIDFYGFFTNILDAIVPGRSLAPKKYGLNPANSPFGSSSWRTVRTEAELTPAREKEPVSNIEYHWSGWLLSKSGMLDILDQLENKGKEANFGLRLIRREEFTSMGHMQMYDLHSLQLVYPEALDHLKGILFATGGLLGAVKKVLSLGNRMDAIAEAEKVDTGITQLPEPKNVFEEEILAGMYAREFYMDPWMKKILEIRRRKPTNSEESVKWMTHAVSALEENLPFGQFVDLLGKENTYFEIGLSGFRTNDENGDLQYYSDSVGTVNVERRDGAFQEAAKIGNIDTLDDFILRSMWFIEGY